MIDGESPKDAGYALMGTSKGDEICHPFLSSTEIFDFLIDCEQRYPQAIWFGFGFNLDVSYAVKDLPRRCISALHHFNRTVWNGYAIEHIPHKWFKLTHGEVTIQIFDVHSFFGCAYVPALEAFKIGTTEEIETLRAEKARRAEFLWAEIEDIKRYFRLELKLGPPLMDTVRKAFFDGGQFVPRSWHGPGAVARLALRRNKIYDAMSVTPPEVQAAARYAFAGGRFELFRAGHAQQTVYEADINSAYPYYATMLPNLAHGSWRHGREYEPGKFGVYLIEYDDPDTDPMKPHPLFRRFDDYSVSWPSRVRGWYWAPEAELVADNPNAKFIDSLIFNETTSSRPFAFLAEYYDHRQALKRAGSYAEYTYKLIINSVYGQLAQRTGWDRKRNKAPKSHQLEWAGFITSGCRAAVYRTAVACGDKLIAINTDSVQALCPIDTVNIGPALGQWKPDEYEDGIFWQSGIYTLKKDGEWKKAKTRGIAKGAYSADDLIQCLATGEPLRIPKHAFITYGLADNGQWDKLNTWVTEDAEYVMGGTGKRQHNNIMGIMCKRTCGQMHHLTMLPFRTSAMVDPMSHPHYLPWLDGKNTDKDAIGTYVAFSIDAEDEWMIESVAA
jgi:hypothetical protein